jgi:hypothetical protein
MFGVKKMENAERATPKNAASQHEEISQVILQRASHAYADGLKDARTSLRPWVEDLKLQDSICYGARIVQLLEDVICVLNVSKALRVLAQGISESIAAGKTAEVFSAPQLLVAESYGSRESEISPPHACPSSPR